VAHPRTKDYGILSVAVQTFTEPRTVTTVPPSCFFPPPKVTSRVVSLRFRDIEGIAGVEHIHRRLLRAAFNQRRKTLRNSLAAVIADQQARERILETAGIGPTQRAEELGVADFVRLAHAARDAQGTTGPAEK
jgi:16S rRNA (adenine1518-N6/adenine1519-N6)-dimethyltransferase